MFGRDSFAMQPPTIKNSTPRPTITRFNKYLPYIRIWREWEINYLRPIRRTTASHSDAAYFIHKWSNHNKTKKNTTGMVWNRILPTLWSQLQLCTDIIHPSNWKLYMRSPYNYRRFPKEFHDLSDKSRRLMYNLCFWKKNLNDLSFWKRFLAERINVSNRVVGEFYVSFISLGVDGF